MTIKTTSITIRNLDEEVKSRLHIRAKHHRSIEEEAQHILRDAVGCLETPTPKNLATAIRARIAPLGGVDLELPLREIGRDPPSFK